MYRSILFSLSIFSFFQIPLAYSAPIMSTSTNLQKLVATIQTLPEGQKLIQEIEKQGPIRFVFTQDALAKQFGAFWDPQKRTIHVNPNWHQSEGRMIGSIVFELHNALVSSQFDRLDSLAFQRKISKKDYVKEVEYIEYQNSLRTAKIVDKGIELGLFPPTAKMFTYASFDEHFYYQKEGGHSAVIAQSYDELTRNRSYYHS